MANTEQQEYNKAFIYTTFNTEVDVVFLDTREPISSCQQNTYDRLAVKLEELTQVLFDKVFIYYTTCYQDYKEGWSTGGTLSDAELERHLPAPVSSEVLKAHLTPLAIYIPAEAKCKEGTLGISFDCTWDIKSGLGVYIRDWEIVEVSTSDSAFIYFQ